MQVAERQHDLRSVEPRPILRKYPTLLEVEEQLAAVGELHNETQMKRRLETVR